MPRIDIRGTVVPDSDIWIYDWFGIEATAPCGIRKVLQEANGADVDVVINSGGGDVMAGTEIYTMLREYDGKVLIRIQSFAASAAAVIAMAGESEMSPVAQLMIHNVSSYAQGDNRDMEHMAEVLATANRALATAFTAKSGKSEAEVLELMARESWFTAEQAVQEGLVDRVMFADVPEDGCSVKLAASYGSGLLPYNVIVYAREHINNPTAGAKPIQLAQAEYNYLILEGKTK